jgi:hypothetical protein
LRGAPWRHLSGSLIALVVSTSAWAGSSIPDTCPAGGSERVHVVSVSQRLELNLADGRTLRLAAFEPVGPTPEHPDFDTIARNHLAGSLTNVIDVLPLAKPDRWGRVPVFAFLPGASADAPAQPLAAWLLARGYGRFMPDREAVACQTRFLAAESAARAGQVGLWHDPYYAVIPATDTAAFAEKAATNVIVEGQVVDVDVRPKRIYLLFGARHTGAFAVTILQRDVGIFDQAGLDPRNLIGDRLRVRGLLDLRFGPEIEATEPGALEIVTQPQASPSTGQHVEANTADSADQPH